MVSGCAVSQTAVVTSPGQSGVVQAQTTREDLGDVVGETPLEEQAVVAEVEGVQVHKSEPKQEPVDLHESCFTEGDVVFSQPFIPSSVMVNQGGGNALFLNTLNDDIFMIKPLADRTFKTIQLASQAQVACVEAVADGYRVGMIQRDARQADYRLEILQYDAQDRHTPSADWSAGTRGFVPDAGTRCVLLGRRDVVMSGTRPRGDRAPYHGIFRMRSRALTLFESTTEHVPEIVDMLQDRSGKVEILTRQVRRNAENKPEWPHIVYALKDESTIEPVLEADFIVRQGDVWTQIRKNGCLVQDQGDELCPDQEMVLSEVQWIGHRDGADYYVYRAKDHAWLARASEGRLALSAIPKTWHFFSVIQPETGDWLMAVQDAVQPDKADNLKYVKPDMSCIWGQNTPAEP